MEAKREKAERTRVGRIRKARAVPKGLIAHNHLRQKIGCSEFEAHTSSRLVTRTNPQKETNNDERNKKEWEYSITI